MVLWLIFALLAQNVGHSVWVVFVDRCVTDVEPYTGSNGHVVPNSTLVTWKYRVGDFDPVICGHRRAKVVGVVDVRVNVPGLQK